MVQIRQSDGPATTMKDNPLPDSKLHDDLPKPDIAEARLRQQAIGVRLRHLFDEIVNEPVPDEFLSILKNADERNRGGA